jgi:hypothetical protein
MNKDIKGLLRICIICITFLGSYTISFGQGYSKDSPVIRFSSHNGMMVDINQIDSLNFNSFQNDTYKDDHYKTFEDGVKTESEISKQHPGIFRKTKGAYIFPIENGDTIRLKKITKDEDLKGMMDYKFIGQFENFTVIYADGYEWWSYYLVDLNGKTNYSIPGEPKFNYYTKTVIGWDNYYGNSDLSIIDLEYNHDCIVSFDNYEIDGFKTANTVIVLKLSNSVESRLKSIYFRISWDKFMK